MNFNFIIGEKIDLKVRDKQKGRWPKWKNKSGEIIGVTERFIVVQLKNYKETYMISDFKDGAAVLEGVSM